MSNAEPFYIYRPTKPIGAINVAEDALPWVYDQDPSSGFCARMLVVPAVALEAADKRIAELERKLAVAREALNNLASWGEGECVTGCFDEPVAAAVSRQALAQIGEK